MAEEIFKPGPDISDKAHVKDYEKVYQAAVDDPEKFWAEIARDLSWVKPWEKVLEWKPPFAKWFVGAKCNIVQNALDRHLEDGRKNKLALIWQGQDGQVRKFTYAQLNKEVSKFANVLKKLGLVKGDRVSVYLPRIPEQVISMLACAKLGVIHSVVYCGFSVQALKTRVGEAEAKLVITTDSYQYREKWVETKAIVDQAVQDIDSVEHVLVVKRSGRAVEMTAGRDVYYEELAAQVSDQCETETMDAEDPLFILYTSGTTGKPKGVIHTQGGYMVGIYITLKWIFNIEEDDIWWCTADPGWITGHSYITYAPFILGLTQFFYEGPPDYPDAGKWWSLIEKYKVSKFYTTPTAIRSLMRQGEEWPQKFDLGSLKILGTVGEPIDSEAWLWYHQYIGGERCPIMDTWWQTETGMQMIAPLPCVPLKPGSAFKPFPGVVAAVVDKKGQPVKPGQTGFLVLKTPWPAMLRTLYKNPERYKKTYWQEIPGFYFAGDAAKIDEDGYFWIAGRTDEVLKVSDYRFGTAELEDAFNSHEAVVETAVIGIPHKIKGQAIKGFVILAKGYQPSAELKEELRQHVRKQIGPIATPEEIEFVDSLPKTRSGKIMRRVLKAKELGQPLGDISTLSD